MTQQTAAPSALPLRADQLRALAGTAARAGHFERADTLYRLLATTSSDPVALYDLASHRIAGARWAEARRALQRAVALAPDLPPLAYSLAFAEEQLGDFTAAVAHFRWAVTLQPGYALARQALGTALLRLGEERDGWREYAWRLRLSDLPIGSRPQAPLWRAEGGRTVLVVAEQGLGDIIQFARYLPLVQAGSNRVVFECPRVLIPLLRHLPGIDQLVARGDALPEFDCWVPLLTLGALYGLDAAPQSPYIALERLRVEEAGRFRAWRERIAALPGPRIAVAWHCKADHGLAAVRSAPLAALLPLAARATLISVQKNEGSEQAIGTPLVDWTADMDPPGEAFLDTLCVLDAVDAVVTVDTSIAHLAGAMGRLVHVLLPFVADWRWYLGRGDSPWYRSMRLHRQRAPGDWSGPVADVAAQMERP